MRKPPTGEPCAGEPHARFGGRGRRKPFPTPIPFKTNLIAEFCHPQFAAGSVIVGGTAKELLDRVRRVLIIVA